MAGIEESRSRVIEVIGFPNVGRGAKSGSPVDANGNVLGASHHGFTTDWELQHKPEPYKPNAVSGVNSPRRPRQTTRPEVYLG